MRRARQQLSDAECVSILNDATNGVLAVAGDDGYPYAVPLSYVYIDGKILFHCAKAGHKLDAILHEPKVSFCVVAQDQVMPEEFTTYFRSVVAFGKARVLEDPHEIRAAIEALAKKYSPNVAVQARDHEIETAGKRMLMIAIDVEHLTGKEAKELVQARA